MSAFLTNTGNPVIAMFNCLVELFVPVPKSPAAEHVTVVKAEKFDTYSAVRGFQKVLITL